MRHSDRGVSPVISTILLVAIVVVLAATISVFVLGLGENISDPSPSVALDTGETENGTVKMTHVGGETIDREKLTVKGGEINEAETPETIQAGATIGINPDPAAEEVTLVYEDQRNSAILASAIVDDAITSPVILDGQEFSANSLEEYEEELAPEEEIELEFNEPTELTLVAENGLRAEAERECESGDTLTYTNSGTGTVTITFEEVNMVENVDDDDCTV